MTNVSGWLATVDEPAVEPELPIIDTHHHLWGRPGTRYLLDELLADTAAHNVRQTVFVECSSMYRADGPEELKSVGETEFVRGIAAQSASGQYGEMRAATAIVGASDLTLGRKWPRCSRRRSRRARPASAVSAIARRGPSRGCSQTRHRAPTPT